MWGLLNPEIEIQMKRILNYIALSKVTSLKSIIRHFLCPASHLVRPVVVSTRVDQWVRGSSVAMTNILPNESQNLLTANTIWQALKLWWLYYPVDTTLAKYSSKDDFPSLCIQAGTEEISEAQKNNAPNIPAHLFGAFLQQMHCPCKLKKKTQTKKQSKTPKSNKLFTLSALAHHFLSHSHLFSFTQLETREEASNIQPLCSLGVGAVKRLELQNGLILEMWFFNCIDKLYMYWKYVFYHQKNYKSHCQMNRTVKGLNKIQITL